MLLEQLKQVKILFEQAIILPPKDRKAFLDERCQDVEVRKEVESQLTRYREAQNLPLSKRSDTVIAPPILDGTLSTTVVKQDGSDNDDSDDEYYGVESVGSEEVYFKDLVGQKLNNTYLIEEKLGEGGMGVVFRGTHLLLNNQVAVKVMLPTIKRSDNEVKRFQREARVGWALSHPNIIKVHEFSQTSDGILFMVMELVKGENLKNHIRRLAPLSAARCAEILRPLCDALDVAHKRNLLHRDLKPANILLSDQDGVEVVKLADFGIVKLLEPDGQFTTEGVSLTNTGTVIGSVSYMSPEQLMGYKLSANSDIYSLGVVLHEMITGRLPVQGFTLRESLMLKTEYHKLPPISSLYPFIPSAFDELFQKVLSPIPQQRYQKAGELLNAFKACL